MKKRILITLMAIGLLAGCGTAQWQQTSDLQSWAVGARTQAKAGEMKWSEYYKGLFKKLSEMNNGNQTFLMELSSNMIDVSLMYEEGTIDKKTFESYERQAEISAQRGAAQQDQAQRAAWAASMQSLSKTFEQRSQMYQNQLNRQKTCTTKWTGYAWQSTCN